mgnify:CR=1 FL=1
MNKRTGLYVSRPRVPGSRLAGWKEAFARDWNAGKTILWLVKRYEIASHQGVRALAMRMRRSGVEMERRISRGHGKRGTWGLHGQGRSHQREFLLSRVPVTPAIIYDAGGRAMAMMDPVTRKRAALPRKQKMKRD